MSENLEGGGATSNVVVIICPLFETGLIDMSNYERGAITPCPSGADGPEETMYTFACQSKIGYIQSPN